MSTELDNLAGLVADADLAGLPAPAAAAPDPDAPPPPPGPEEQAVDLVNMFSGLVVGYAPAAAEIWTDQAKQASAAVITPLIIKYNFSLTALPPELTAAIVVGPLLYKSATIVAEKMKGDRAAKAAPRVAGPAPAAPGEPALVGVPGEAPPVAVHSQMALYKP